ncbi:hypothetical protein C9374_007182 [Naegleria lovaniensis]|uniref:Uncharacterized protein n=1 Tax=Naegleria lovaniensis TaxID=51637 RepID=A0AA88KRX7_NAELO|nr:uncharacterized protein C9374_007182 [Naegleria lovaniensis]KAG2393651.1 hypothetical protein C9374_007182 [Naegleria lovaniensis]
MKRSHLARFFAHKYQAAIRDEALKKKDQGKEASTDDRNDSGPQLNAIFKYQNASDEIFEILPTLWYERKREPFISDKSHCIVFNDAFLFDYIRKTISYFSHYNCDAHEKKMIEGMKLLVKSSLHGERCDTKKMERVVEELLDQCNSQIYYLKRNVTNGSSNVKEQEQVWQRFTLKASLVISALLIILNITSRWKREQVPEERELKIQEFNFLSLQFIHELCLMSHSERVLRSLDIIEQKKNPSFVRKVARFFKVLVIERAYQYSSFNQALYFVSIFGSRLFPSLFKKLFESIEKFKGQHITDSQHGKKKKTSSNRLRDVEFLGFIVGSIFGAGGCASVVLTGLDYLKEKGLGTHMKDTPLKVVGVSKSFWMTVGALFGIFVNIAVRHSLRKGVTVVLQKYLNNPQFIKNTVGKQNELMAKLMIRTFAQFMDKETKKILFPKFNDEKKKIPTNDRQSKSSSLTVFMNDPFILSLIKDRVTSLKHMNPYLGSLIEMLLSEDENTLFGKSKKLYSYITTVKAKYSGILNRLIPVPSENSKWHYWSTYFAFYFANIFSKQVADLEFEQKEQVIYELNSGLTSILNAFVKREHFLNNDHENHSARSFMRTSKL